MRFVIIATLSILTARACAETTAPTGQPLCTSADALHEYLIAALVQKDRKAMSAVSGCAMVKGGLRMDVIEKGDPTSGMHVDKVRVFGAKGSGVGYTMNVDP